MRDCQQCIYCLLNIDPSRTALAVVVIGTIVIVYQLSLGIATDTFHVLTMKSISNSRANVYTQKIDQNPEKSIIVQLVVIPMAYTICWGPTNILLVIMMTIPSYPLGLIPWTCACIMSLNAVFYPLICTVFVQKKFINRRKFTKTKSTTYHSPAGCSS